MYMRFNKSIYAIILIIVTLNVFALFNYADDRNNKCREYQLRFVCKTEVYGVVRETSTGEIQLNSSKSNIINMLISVDTINRIFEKEGVEDTSIPLSPFEASVVIDRTSRDIELSLEIKESDNKISELESSSKYRYAYLIIDMLLLNRDQLSQVPIKISMDTIDLSLQKVERVQVAGFGKLPETELRTSVSPTKFKMPPLPGINDDAKVHLYSMVQAGSSIKLFTRSLVIDDLWVEHAINIVASGFTYNAKELTADKLNSQLLDIDNFQEYELYELTTYE